MTNSSYRYIMNLERNVKKDEVREDVGYGNVPVSEKNINYK